MRIVLYIAALAASFLFGAYTVKKETKLYSAMVVSGNWLLEKPAEFNYRRQYVLTADKNEIPCPAQTERTIVAFVFGQSNAANYLGQKYVGTENVINYFDGRCYRAADPLLGAAGRQGSLWTLVGNKLAANGYTVVLIPIGIASVSVSRWADGDLTSLLTETILGVKQKYTVTDFLWHQGEGDAWKTSTEDYSARLKTVIATTRQFFPESAFYVSTASACRRGPDESVQRGQRTTINPASRIYAGPNTDDFIGIEDRYDGCHLSAIGQEKIASLWEKAILENYVKRSTIIPN